MNKTFKITVDTHKSVQNPSFHVNTNDLRTIHLLMSVQSNGEPVNLEDAQVRIVVLKPDKKTVFQDVVVVDAASGLCEVILDSQAYVVPGEHTAELMIYFVGERVSVTGRINYRAISGILNDKTVESQNEYQAINKLVLDAETAAQNAKRSETNAKESELVAKQAETNAVNATANALDELEERTEQFYEQKAAELRAPIDDLTTQLAQTVYNGIGVNSIFNSQMIGTLSKEIEKYKKQRFIQGQATITAPKANGYFRDSDPFVTVSINEFAQINAPNYDVLVTPIRGDVGLIGNLVVYDKTRNGFKVKMTGSAKSVTFLWTILNPNV